MMVLDCRMVEVVKEVHCTLRLPLLFLEEKDLEVEEKELLVEVKELEVEVNCNMILLAVRCKRMNQKRMSLIH
jgi:hypothetical protein